jgi:hypothetical protein
MRVPLTVNDFLYRAGGCQRVCRRRRRLARLQQHGHASMQASSAQLFALIAPFPRRWWRGLPRRVWCLDRAQGGQQRLSVEGDVEASEQADQGERAFDRVVPGDAEQVQSPVDAVLPGLGGDQ